MDKIQLSKLLDNYVKGICTPDEIAIINKWYNQYEIDGPGYITSLTDNERDALKSKMFARIILNDDAITKDEEAPVKVLAIVRNWWFAAAAAAVLLMFIKFFVFAPHTNIVKNTGQLIADIKFINNTNTIVKQVLPDSSTVWIEPHSSLTYPKVFTPVSRKVTMQGECFFEVTKNPRRPFIINSNHLVTKVWGTSFKVTDYGSAATATVVVVTGKVSVSKKDSKDSSETTLNAGEILLHPKEKVVYHADKSVLTQVKQVDMSSLNIWNHIDLSFDNIRLTDIVMVLNKKFDANIDVRDKLLGNAAMTADLNDLNLPDVLEVLKVSLKLDYEINGTHILLKKTN